MLRFFKFICVRGARVSPVLLASLAIACGGSPVRSPPDAEPIRRVDATGPFGRAVGRVIDEATGRPLAHMVVLLDDYPLGMVDENGWYHVSLDQYMLPGWHSVRVGGGTYIEERRTVWLVDGVVDTVHLRLRRAPRPCCSLVGDWAIDLTLDEKGSIGPDPTKRLVSGSLSFADSFPPIWERSVTDDFVNQDDGRYAIDLSPFFGQQIAEDASFSIFGSTEDPFQWEALGRVYAWDSVSIDLVPRISHGGLSLTGRLQGDSIMGEWYQRAYCCGAVGHFVMTKR